MKSRMYWSLLGEELAAAPDAMLPMACSTMFESNLRTSSVEQIMLCYISSSRFYPASASKDEAVLRAVVQEALHHGFELHALTILDGRSNTLGEHLVALANLDGTMSQAASRLLHILIETSFCGHPRSTLTRLSAIFHSSAQH